MVLPGVVVNPVAAAVAAGAVIIVKVTVKNKYE